MTLKFQELPPDGRRAPVRGAAFDPYAAEKAELRANPGRWAVIERIKRPGQIYSWRKHGFEIRTRKDENGVMRVYVRYAGEAQ